jgi:hypothetical protein
MNARIKYPYLIILLLQLLLVIIAFKDFRIHPQQIIFCGSGDGLKNYFTLLSYVKWPDHNLFQYHAFNYPFGEYVFTTDNTPLFAIPFKWLCQHIYDLSDYTLPIYNTFIILNIVACGLLCFAVLRRLIKQDLFALMMSIVLSWTNMQVMRIWRGHFNLSLSSFLVAAILLTVLWQEQKESRKKRYLIGLAMIALNYVSFLAHGYYIAIIGVFQSAVLFFSGLYAFKSKSGKLSVISAVLIPAISLAFVLLTIKATDGFYALRSTGSGGYDWMETKVRFWGLFTHNEFQTLFFPIKATKGSWDPENSGYLGNVGLYSLLILTLAALASKTYRHRIKCIQTAFFTSPSQGPLFFGSLLMLIISFGELYYTGDLNEGLIIYNFLNPLYFIHQFTDAVTQFRALGRFAWPFFWGFNFWMIYTVVALLPSLSQQLKIAIVIAIAVLGGAEVKDYVDAMQAKASEDNLLNVNAYNKIKDLDINFSRYQAMLSLPYYNVGAESSDYTLDDYDASSAFSYQMALFAKLPLINTKLSRTVLAQAKMLDSLVAFDSTPLQLQKKFNNKAVLVFLNKKVANELSLNNRPIASEIQQKSVELTVRNHLQPIDSLGEYVFYEWYPKTSF